MMGNIITIYFFIHIYILYYNIINYIHIIIKLIKKLKGKKNIILIIITNKLN